MLDFIARPLYNDKADKLTETFRAIRSCRVVGRARTIGNRVGVKSTELSRSWSSAHDWKSCRGQKLLESSNLSNSAKKKEPAAGRFFLFAFGEIRILIEGPGGAFIVQCAHWTIPLFCFPISREENKMQANLSNSASEELNSIPFPRTAKVYSVARTSYSVQGLPRKLHIR